MTFLSLLSLLSLKYTNLAWAQMSTGLCRDPSPTSCSQPHPEEKKGVNYEASQPVPGCGSPTPRDSLQGALCLTCVGHPRCSLNADSTFGPWGETPRIISISLGVQTVRSSLPSGRRLRVVGPAWIIWKSGLEWGFVGLMGVLWEATEGLGAWLCPSFSHSGCALRLSPSYCLQQHLPYSNDLSPRHRRAA